MFSVADLNAEVNTNVKDLTYFTEPQLNLLFKIMELSEGKSSNGTDYMTVEFQCVTPGESEGKKIRMTYFDSTADPDKKGVSGRYKFKQLVCAAGMCDENGQVINSFKTGELVARSVIADVVASYKNPKYFVLVNIRSEPLANEWAV